MVGLASRPAPAIRRRSSASYAMPEPTPPIVYDGRQTTGKPRVSAAASQSARLWQITLRATSPPSDSTMALNDSRFSPASMASMDAPISSTPNFSSVPSWARATAVLSAVWPPSVASSASGRSLSITLATKCGVIGSM